MSTTFIYSKEELANYKKFQHSKHIYVIPDEDKEFNRIEFSGAGIFNEEFVTKNTTDITSQVAKFKKSDIENLQIKMRGTLTVFLENNNNYYVLPDPLGTSLTFYYEGPNLNIISTSLKAIVNILSELGIEIKRNLEFNLESIGISNSGFTNTPYFNIHTLNPFQYALMNDRKCEITLNSEYYRIIEKAKISTFEDTVNSLVTTIKSNLTLVDKYSTNDVVKICHLTGGFDSRLVLAGLLNLKLHTNYNYFCSGRKGTPDKDIYHKLTLHYGLTQTNFNGLKVLAHPDSLKEKLIWESDFSEGMSLNVHDKMEESDNLIIGGAYGGLVRSYFSNKGDMKEFNSYQELVADLWPNLDNKIFDSDFIYRFSERFRDLINEAKKLGYSNDSLLDYIYIRVRNRYHFGAYISNINKITPRFDPLYSVESCIMALFQEENDRSSNSIGLKAMEKLYPELLELPFDKKKITPYFEGKFGRVINKDFQQNYKLNHNNIQVSPIKKSQRTVGTKSDVEKANRMKVNLWQVAEMKDAQQGLKEILTELPKESLNKFINVDYVSSLVSKEIDRRDDLRNLHNLYSNLVWYSL